MVNSAHQTHYSTLGVSQGATQQEIQKAFRKLARQHHPDVAGNSANTEAQMKSLNQAYAALSDPAKRRQYDAELRYAQERKDRAKEAAQYATNTQREADTDEYAEWRAQEAEAYRQEWERLHAKYEAELAADKATEDVRLYFKFGQAIVTVLALLSLAGIIAKTTITGYGDALLILTTTASNMHEVSPIPLIGILSGVVLTSLFWIIPTIRVYRASGKLGVARIRSDARLFREAAFVFGLCGGLLAGHMLF